MYGGSIYRRNVSHASNISARIQAVRIHVCNTSHLRIDEFGADIECLIYWGKLSGAS